MNLPKLQPVKSVENLRDRVVRFFCEDQKEKEDTSQLSLDISRKREGEFDIDTQSESVKEFLDFISDAMPSGDIYLFGGILRDLALLGKRGFNSDIDLVVEGDWTHLAEHLERMGAHKNKFGGYRLDVAEWPIDIWNAKETWAIKQKIIPYQGVSSLIETTVLNWDAILMNWRTREFIYRKDYFEDINSGKLDIVLEKNPNPLGMAVRVFRHALLKEAKKIRLPAIKYMADNAKRYGFEQLRDAEMKSYSNTVIEAPRVRFFENLDLSEDIDIIHEISVAGDILKQELEFSAEE